MDVRNMMRSLAVLLALAVTATATDQLTLVLKDGNKRTVTPLSFDETGLAAKYGADEVRYPWADLAPDSAYAARKALTPYNDGAAILDLSRFARRLQLYPEAIEQLEIALALGGLDEAAFEKERKEVAAEEIDFLTATIDSLLETDAEPEECLAAIKRLKERYPDDEANKK